MGSTEAFLAEMQKRRQQQLAMIQQMFGQRNQTAPVQGGTGPNMPPGIIRGLVNGIIGGKIEQGLGAGGNLAANALGLGAAANMAGGAPMASGVAANSAASAAGAQSASAGAGTFSSAGGTSWLASLFSSRRFKHAIEPYAQVGDLRWVRFQYLPEMDPAQQQRIGLIAEELVTTHPDLVVYGDDGLPERVRYDRLRDDQWP